MIKNMKSESYVAMKSLAAHPPGSNFIVHLPSITFIHLAQFGDNFEITKESQPSKFCFKIDMNSCKLLWCWKKNEIQFLFIIPPLLDCSLECEQDLCWASWCSVKLLSYIMLGRGGRDIKKEKSQREWTLWPSSCNFEFPALKNRLTMYRWSWAPPWCSRFIFWWGILTPGSKSKS